MKDVTSDLAADAPARPASADPQPGRRFGRLRLLTLGDCDRLPPRRWLLRGLIGEGDLALIYGAPKTGKSFLAVRLLYGLAMGAGFGSHEATRPARALYVSAEGEAGFPARLIALRDRLGDAGDGFAFVAQRAVIGDPGDDLPALIEAARAHRAEVVALDTVARTFGAGDENTTRDMTAYLAALERLRDEGRTPGGPPLSVVLIHHSPKHGTGARGSVALPAGADVVLRVERRGGGANVAILEDAKDGPSGAEVPFRLATVDLPRGRYAEPRETCIAEPASRAAAPPRERLPPNARKALGFLGDAVADEGEPLPPEWHMPSDLRAVVWDTWRARCRERGLAADPEAFRSTFRRASGSRPRWWCRSGRARGA
jgi:hypothetical protein